MKKRESGLLAILLVLFLFLMIGCSKKEGQKTTESQDMNNPTFEVKSPEPDTTKQTSESSASPTDEYRPVDPAELHIVFEAQLTRLSVDSDGNVRAVEGVVTTMSVGDTKIELASDKITMEDTDAFVTTKEYGKIKVTFNSNAQSTFWLTASQKKNLLKLKK